MGPSLDFDCIFTGNGIVQYLELRGGSSNKQVDQLGDKIRFSRLLNLSQIGELRAINCVASRLTIETASGTGRATGLELSFLTP